MKVDFSEVSHGASLLGGPGTSRVSPSVSPVLACLVAVTAVGPFPHEAEVVLLLAAAVLAGNARRRTASTDLIATLPMVLLLLWTLVSVIWSVSPVSTLVGSATTTLLAALGAVLAARKGGLDELTRTVATAFRWLVLLTWVLALVDPSVARTQESYQNGSLEGPFAHRNLLAYVMVLAVLTFAVRAAAALTRRGRLVEAFWAIAGLVTMLATQSSTSVVVLLAVGSLWTALIALARVRVGLRRLMAVPALTVLVLGVTMGVTHLSVVVAPLGRDATLTGRTDIWAVALEFISRRPLVGYGWDALWIAGNDTTEAMWERAGFAFYHAHDGFLDVTLQVGLVGLILLSVFTIHTTVLAWRFYTASPTAIRSWPLLVIAALVAYNVTETVLAVHIGWLLMATLASQLRRSARLGPPHASPSPIGSLSKTRRRNMFMPASNLISLALRRWPVMLALVVLGLIGGGALAVLQPQSASSVNLLIRAKTESDRQLQLAQPDRFLANQMQILQSATVIEKASETLTSKPGAAPLRETLDVQAGPDADAIHITAKAASAEEASARAEAVARAYSADAGGTISVLMLSSDVTTRSQTRSIGVGGILGAVLAALGVILFANVRPRVSGWTSLSDVPAAIYPGILEIGSGRSGRQTTATSVTQVANWLSRREKADDLVIAAVDDAVDLASVTASLQTSLNAKAGSAISTSQEGANIDARSDLRVVGSTTLQRLDTSHSAEPASRTVLLVRQHQTVLMDVHAAALRLGGRGLVFVVVVK